MKLVNSNVRFAVNAMLEFTANNLFAEKRGCFYVVFSYGRHWPLWAYDRRTDCWYENRDKYSVTTSRHKAQSRPVFRTVPVPVSEMLHLLAGGAK